MRKLEKCSAKIARTGREDNFIVSAYSLCSEAELDLISCTHPQLGTDNLSAALKFYDHEMELHASVTSFVYNFVKFEAQYAPIN